MKLRAMLFSYLSHELLNKQSRSVLFTISLVELIQGQIPGEVFFVEVILTVPMIARETLD